ncbi:hypothetical protein ACWDUN_09775 [Mycobacterium sp. NPDC003323]
MKTTIAKIFLLLLFAPLGVFCLVWTALYLSRAELASAIVSFGFGSFTLGLVALLIVIARRAVRPRAAIDRGGLLIRPDVRVDGLLVGATAGAFLAMLTYAVCAPMGLIKIAVPRDDEKYYVIACVVAVVVGASSLRQIVLRRGANYLRLTEDGLEMGNTMTSVVRAWTAVTDISDKPEKARQATGTTYIKTSDGQTRDIPSDWYTPNGQALRELLRFYWQHPGARGELADRRAVDRLSAQSQGSS